MPRVYVFKGFPRQVAFAVGEGESVAKAATDALTEWAKTAVTRANLQAHIDNETISYVKTFPDTDKGWDKAMDSVDGLETYQ